jgi:hypothetical protein
MTNEKKSPLPVWLSLSVPELRRLLNLVFPLPTPTQALRLHWFRWRRQHRFRAIASRFHIDTNILLRLALPP